MKKFFVTISMAFILLLLFGASAGAEALGTVYDSNTNAFIDGYQIPVYTYNNYPYIVAEDLGGYGFNCKWEAVEDILYINYDYNKVFYPYDYVELMPAQGKELETVYKSDTRVKLGDEFINAYSIGGRMLISLDELYRFGAVNWYPDSQTIAFTSRRFIDLNPDWKTLMPASYIIDVTDNYFRSTFSLLNEYLSEFVELDEYFEKYGYWDYNYYAYTPIYLSSDVREKLVLLNEQLLAMTDSIQDNRTLYYKAEAYHTVYAAALTVKDIITLYDAVNGKNYDTVTYSAQFESIAEAINSQSDVYVEKHESYANKVWEYIYY